jgi:hypothetical protein
MLALYRCAYFQVVTSVCQLYYHSVVICTLADAFGSNFWMLLVEGKKKWTFFSEADLPLLRPTYPFSFDPVFPKDVLTTTPARAFEVELQAGEMIFVPAGSPHAVTNLSTTVALSGNYVDESNIAASLLALGRDGLTCPRARALWQALQAMEQRPGQRAEARRRGDTQACCCWRDFKRELSTTGEGAARGTGSGVEVSVPGVERGSDEGEAVSTRRDNTEESDTVDHSKIDNNKRKVGCIL